MSETFDKLKKSHLLEQHRLDTFEVWPFEDDASCNIRKMAEAGFYWSGNKREKDTVTCFICSKTLDGWESGDDPWKEHEKHSPQCIFVKYGRKEADLTVKEFLAIFGAVIKNKMTRSLDKTRKDFRRLAEEELQKFTSKQV